MGTVSRVHTFASGAILTAAQLNNEFDNLLTSSAINGGLDATNLGVTAGQATASKALVVDASRNLADATGSNRINNLALSGTFESTGAITASAGITSGGNIVSDTDSTDDLGTTGVRWANLFVDDVTVTNNVTIGGTLTLTGGITLNGNTTIGDSSADTLTVNSTITSNLIFTDATYDIGASGATRPRDLFLSRNAVMGGTLGVTGLITATGGVSGALTGNVTGNVTGNLTGDVTGNISGNVTGGTISGTTGTFSGDVAVNTSTLKVDTANNRVSIGTVSPDALLHLKSSSSSAAVHSYTQALIETSSHSALQFSGSTSGEQWIWFADDSSSPPVGGITYYHGGPYMAFRVEGSTRATLDSTGLGLGTASPSTLLELNSSSGPEITLQRDDTSIAANDVVGGIRFSSNDSSTAFGSPPHYGAGIKVKSVGTVGLQNMFFYAGQNNLGYENDTPSMRLDQSGDVHFYDTSPAVGMTWDASASSLGIGTGSPSALIHAEAADGTEGGAIKYTAKSQASAYLSASPDGAVLATDTAGIVFRTGITPNDPTDTGTERARIDSSGNLLVGYTSSNGSYLLQVNSQIFATNATIATSDGRYKEDVQKLSNATDLVTRLNPVQFRWKAHETHNFDVGKTDVGFIAQEVQAVLSDTDYSDSVVVTNKTDDEEYLGLGETKLIPLLTAALQEAITKIEALETKVAALEAA